MPKMIIEWRAIRVSLLLLTVCWLLLSCVPSGGPAKKGGKTCLDCHPEYQQKFSAGVVHSPVDKGDCSSCHRKHGLIGGAYLKAEAPNLCFFCHKDLVEDLKKVTVLHPPVQQGLCADCHQPHNAPAKFLLGGERNAICYNCHDAEPFNQQYQHQPLAKGCDVCHQTHGGLVANLLLKEEAELCADCHSTDNRTFVVSHGGYPVSAKCSDCHDAHSADNPKLLRTVAHQPMASGQCSDCHQSTKSAEPFALKAEGRELCAICHAEQLRQYEVDGAHDPAAEGECQSCHKPHASDFAGMLAKQPQQLCFDCHSFSSFGPDADEEVGGSHHTPAVAGDCLACHNPHVSPAGQSALLRKPGNKLCLDCHADYAARKKVDHEPVRIGDCLGCHQPHESKGDHVLVRPQRYLCGECHSSVDEDLGLPSLHRPFVAGRCSACHDPHGGKHDKLLRGVGAERCDSCHGTIETERLQPNRHQPFKQGRCALCHNSHGSSQPFMLTGKASQLCVDCHSGRKVLPDTPSAHQNCAICHHAHGNDENNYLLQEQPQLCVNCHEVDRFWNKGVGHSPAVEGDCQACHDPHEPQNSIAKDADVNLCGDCHEIDPATLKRTHQGIDPSASSCLSCHDPHGGPDKGLTLPVKHAPFAEGDCTPCHEGGR